MLVFFFFFCFVLMTAFVQFSPPQVFTEKRARLLPPRSDRGKKNNKKQTKNKQKKAIKPYLTLSAHIESFVGEKRPFSMTPPPPPPPTSILPPATLKCI